MNSMRLASVVASFAVGLVGYASEAFAESPAGSFDPSSIYQPSPNSRPLAVQPPVGVTGAVGGSVRAVSAKSTAVASYDASSFYQPSPNSRPLAVQPPVAVTGAVGSPARPVVLTAPAMPAPAHIETAQPAMALNYTASTAYQPSPNYIKPVVVPVATFATAANASKAPAAVPSRETQVASSLYNPSPNARPVVETRSAAQQRTAALRVSASEGLPGISPNLR